MRTGTALVLVGALTLLPTVAGVVPSLGPSLRAHLTLQDGRIEHVYQPYLLREWDLAWPETSKALPWSDLPWYLHHPQRPMLPTGDVCYVDTALAYRLHLNGLDPGEAYRVMLWYGFGAGGLAASWGYHDLGSLHASRDGTGMFRVDLGHHVPDPDLSAFLIIWQPSAEGYWSAEFGWPATGETGGPGCLY